VSVTRLILGALLLPALFALLLFGGAGTFAWGRAWALIAVTLVTTGVSLVVLRRGSPALLAERFKPPFQQGQPRADKIFVLVFVATSVGAIRVIPEDVFGRLAARPAAVLSAAGLVLFVVGWWILMRALQANAFAAPVVKLQQDRGQRVVDAGPYAIVRHPMYAGAALQLLGLPLWLESWVGMVAALLPIGALMMRIGIEERLLRHELAGYAAYMERVRSRLIPGVW
jgi:protein-S-isoprenylcysteine O-methyltransferase Ste14